ncbi:MAG TPA: tRNA guanosine(34) transglycosylase Tgt [Candidatus Acidoferrales bacterium]|nr:tRNA guanosine(34) transglycosylase Tgt [Candidatus Acidoferrales bacterium]
MAPRFELLKTDPTGARLGRLETPHGVIDTPAFMPVGTAASVKGLTQEMLLQLGVQVLLANTYHLYLRPGHERVRRLGGLHRFMSWPRAILTDSGGYQVFSMAGLREISDEGVRFRSHLDGAEHFFTPELAVEVQWALGADVAMVLDECIEYPASHEHARQAMRRTFEWARRSKQAFALRGDPGRQMQFAIVQGGVYADLRRQSADQMVELDFPGYAIGGLAVGEPRALTLDIAAEAAARLPAGRPRYLMGVGKPEDLPDYVAAGVDMMDCVLPTRNGRNGCLFTRYGRLLIKNAAYADDERPIDPTCACPVCRRYSRAYLRHLYLANELLAPVLNTCHNVYFYLDTMRQIRDAIRSGTLEVFRSDLQARHQAGHP